MAKGSKSFAKSQTNLKRRKNSTHSKSIEELLVQFKDMDSQSIKDHLSQERVLVQSRKSATAINESMETLNKQIDVLELKGVDSTVALEHVNKYVGYKSKTLQVTLHETSGYLKKLVNEVNMFQSSLFPCRYYSFNRGSGVLNVMNKPGGTVKHTFMPEDIQYVRISDVMDTQAMP